MFEYINKTEMMEYHYFYKITNNINGRFYYGVHNTSDLNDGYMGSGTRLRRAYKKYGIENFTKEILKFFDTTKEAFDYEAEVVNEVLVLDENCYNCIKGGKDGISSFDRKGMATLKDKNNNIFYCSVNDPKYLSGEYVGATKGTICVEDKNGNKFRCSINDPKYLSGEYVVISRKSLKNKILAKNKNGKALWVDKNDILYLSGEVIPYMKGLVHTKDKNGKVYTVAINDPRYLSGELIPLYTGTKWSDESKNNLKKIFAEKEHQKGEKNSQFGTKWMYKDNITKKVKKEEIEKYLKNGWKFGNLTNRKTL